eukprot:CAMPEP_0197622296 /NCGR_PEP_ID=MMETSP1338-20131121/2652_1 /TAXON_ID=43686 ORGANISM="Pelagodinium beii, Strain RCC1491" /NCGR_SAMPLE_ID=MMETSP1338 /ASSEMBLY_ACC=CAM_ASM_000754 /LENGTH=581 /DNA_ID=CAMNT_0043192011 /DNA_START=80 /DNA_END=1825 /DNA_ORIENTATION=+
MKKKKQVVSSSVQKRKMNRRGLGSALHAMVKAEGGRKDIEFEDAPETHSSLMKDVPITERAGYPAKRAKGSVDPANWVTNGGKKVIVDFGRHAWLPDEWGQGVKATNTCWRSAAGGAGGTYTVMVSPDGKVFYHRKDAEKYDGKAFSLKRGFDGQVRKAKLQAKEQVQLARMQIKEISSSSSDIGTDSAKSLFQILSPAEQKCIAKPSDFHFCVVSARRATQLEGIRDIFTVQSQLAEVGVTPTWYVDAESLKDYKALGLKAVIGGKLTPSRNKALEDAKRLGKVCVQLSDDISAIEYRQGKRAKDKSDDACNAAHKNTKRYIVSPLTAAQFILAKMRGMPQEKRAKLGGVYMLGSCSRAMASDEFVHQNFILGDFFVVDLGSKTRFDENMTLKEDYDFCCSHIRAHGSVMRCNRMTLNVKHYSNSGGACSNRDKKGEKERKNIAILKSKWPRAFFKHPKRQNEVVMRWPADDDAEGKHQKAKDSKPKSRSQKATKAAVKKSQLKSSSKSKGLPAGKAVLSFSKKASVEYLVKRHKKISGRSVEAVLGKLTYTGNHGEEKTYGVADLRYDLASGYLVAKKR